MCNEQIEVIVKEEHLQQKWHQTNGDKSRIEYRHPTHL
jgi:hypothetical protein